MIHLSKEEVAAGKYKEYCPVRNDFRWNADFTEVTVVPLTWWDEKSYADYQASA